MESSRIGQGSLGHWLTSRNWCLVCRILDQVGTLTLHGRSPVCSAVKANYHSGMKRLWHKLIDGGLWGGSCSRFGARNISRLFAVVDSAWCPCDLNVLGKSQIQRWVYHKLPFRKLSTTTTSKSQFALCQTVEIGGMD